MPKLTEDWKSDYLKNGYAIIEDYLTEAECDELQDDMWKLVEQEFDVEEFNRGGGVGVYDPQHVSDGDSYLFSSADQTKCFLEKGAVDPETKKLRVDKKYSINKAGHNVHKTRSVPRKFTFDDRNRAVCRALGIRRPAICQAMYRYKQKEIGDVIDTHTDSVYLMAGDKPKDNLVGIWLALCDTYIENGGMSFVPGSHKDDYDPHYVRKDENGQIKMVFEGKWPMEVADDKFVPCEVKKGSAVIIHGGVVHRSGVNRTDKPRPIYAIHIIESDGVQWSERNWLQSKEPFSTLY